MTVIDNIICFLNELPADSTYRSSVRKLLQNLRNIGDMSIEDLAECCDVSAPTMARLVRRFGCPSFRQFRTDVVRTLTNYEMENRCFPYVPAAEDPKETYDAYFATLRKAVEALHRNVNAHTALIDEVCRVIHEKSKAVFFVALPNTPANRQFQTDLAVAGKITGGYSSIESRQTCLDKLDADSVILCDVFTQGYNTSFADEAAMLKRAKEKGIPTVAICNDNTPSVPEMAAYPLIYKDLGTSMDRYIADMMMNMLMIRYRALYIDNTMSERN